MRPLPLRDEDRARLAAARWLAPVGPFVAFERSWTLYTDEPALAALMADLYDDLLADGGDTTAHGDFRVVAADGDQPSLVARGEVRLGGGSTPGTTMSALVWGINRWVLDEASRDHLLLHAGGVVRDDGSAVLLPAPSESGKSTLTTGLLDRGLTYLSDEAVALQPDRTVHGYAKPVSIDRGAWEVLAAHQPTADDAGSAYLDRQWHVRASRISPVARSGRLAAVIFPRYDPSAPPALRRLGPSEALLRAANCTFAPGNGRTVELHQVTTLATALAEVPAYELVSGDLSAACDAVLGVMDHIIEPA